VELHSGSFFTETLSRIDKFQVLINDQYDHRLEPQLDFPDLVSISEVMIDGLDHFFRDIG
jgi:hypothetical protein